MNKFLYRIWNKKENKYIATGGIYSKKKLWKVFPREAVAYSKEISTDKENYEVHKFEMTLLEKLDVNRNIIDEKE